MSPLDERSLGMCIEVRVLVSLTFYRSVRAELLV